MKTIDIDEYFYFDFILEGYSLVSDVSCSIAVPKEYPKELKKRLMAAIKSYNLGHKSMDYVIQNYGHLWDFSEAESELEEKVQSILDRAKSIYLPVYEKRCNLKGLPDRVGLVAAGAALLRLYCSFKISAFLIWKGFNFEAMCVNKLILEQIAWAHDVYKITDDKIFKFKPSSSIRKFKGFYPNAGRIYGALNKKAHIDPSVISEIVSFKENEAFVILLRKDTSLISGFYLMALADAYGACIESIYKDYFPKFDFLMYNPNGELIINPNRKSLILLKETKKIINLSDRLSKDRKTKKNVWI